MIPTMPQLIRLVEDAEGDVAAYEQASGIVDRLLRHLHNGDPTQHFGFRLTRFADGVTMLTLRGADIGLTDEDAALWFRFAPVRTYTPDGHFSRFQRTGDPVITVFCLDGDLQDTVAACKVILYKYAVHEVLLHEVIHYLDGKRNPAILRRSTSAIEDKSAYFNNPVEFNAYFNNLAEPLLSFLRAARDENGAVLRRMAKGLGISRDFKATLAMLTERLGRRSHTLQRFYAALTPARRRALLKRLFALHQRIVPLLDMAEGGTVDTDGTTMTEAVGSLAPRWEQPLVRVVGRDFTDTFFHGTAKKNIRTLAAANRPASSRKNTSGRALDMLFPPELNEFHCELFLSDPRQPQQAHMFAQGSRNALAVVRLKPGTRILDLSDEVTRAPSIGLGGPEVLRFFHRPAITDALIAWQSGRIVDGYKLRHPDWQDRLLAQMDPASPAFWVQSWQDTLVAFARAHGFGAIRFADEILVTDRSVLRDARLASEDERTAAATTRTWPGSHRAGLFTDRPTDAHAEAEQALRDGGSAPGPT